MKRLQPGRQLRLPTVIVGLALVALILLPVPFLIFTRYVIQERLSGEATSILRQGNREWTGQLDEKMRLARESVARFSQILSNLPLETSDASLQQFDTLVGRDTDGAWRSRRPLYSPLDEAGIWLPPSYPLTPERKVFLFEARKCTGLYGKGALSNCINTWILPREGGIAIYWPGDPEFV